MTALKQRSAFAAAAHVLRAPSMSWIVDGKINDATQQIMWEDIYAYYGSMSSGEQALYDIALAIWRDQGDVQLNMGTYDDKCWERVIEALLALRPLGSARPATEIADEAIGMFIERMEAGGVYLSETDTSSPADSQDIAGMRAEAVQEIREGMAVRDEDIR